MSYALVNAALVQPLPPARRMVLLALADYANAAGVCWPSVQTIAKRCCLSVRTVFNHLRALVADGLLIRRPRMGRSSVYALIVPTSPPKAEVPPAPQPELESPPTPLDVGSVVAAMRKAGLVGAYDCTPLAELVFTARDGMAEFVNVAAEAARKGKGFPWALTVIRGRRADAKQATPAPKPGRDPALVQIERDRANAVQPPAGIRERLRALRESLTGAKFQPGGPSHGKD